MVLSFGYQARRVERHHIWLPYFAAKAGMDRLAVVYAGELARWGIETSIIVQVPSRVAQNHFAHAGIAPIIRHGQQNTKQDLMRVFTQIKSRDALHLAPDADISKVADAVLVNAPFGRNDRSVHIDQRRTVRKSSMQCRIRFVPASTSNRTRDLCTQPQE